MKQQINTNENLKKKKPMKKMTRYDLKNIITEVYFDEDGKVECIDVKYDEYSDAITFDAEEAEQLFEMLSEVFKKPNAGLPWTHPNAPGIRGPYNPHDKTGPWQPHPLVTWNDSKTTVDGTKTFNTRKNANPDAMENLDWDAKTGKYVEKE